MNVDDALKIAKKIRIFKKMPFLNTKLPEMLHPMIILTPLDGANHVFKLGESRFGNAPDIPKDFTWPILNCMPAICVAQINLADMHACATGLPLPKNGYLYFFINSDWERNPECRVIHIDAPLQISTNLSLAKPLQLNTIYTIPDEPTKDVIKELEAINDTPLNRWLSDFTNRLIEVRELIHKYQLKPLPPGKWPTLSDEERKIRIKVEELEEPFPSSYEQNSLLDTLKMKYQQRMEESYELIKKFNITGAVSKLEWTSISHEERAAREKIMDLQSVSSLVNPLMDAEFNVDEGYPDFAYSLLKAQLKKENIKGRFSLLGYPSTEQLYDQPEERVLLSLYPAKKEPNVPPEWKWTQLVFLIPSRDLEAGCFENVKARHLFD